jgi:tight adherence protein C
VSISDLSAALAGVRLTVLVLFGVATGVFVKTVAAVPVLEPPRYGLRGKRRARARESGGFAALEPVLGVVAGWFALLPPGPMKVWLARLATSAGEPAGLCAEELMAMTLLSTSTLGAFSAYLVSSAGFSSFWSASVLLLCFVLPCSRVHAMAKERAKQLERSLPSAMDLCVLCMGAGADFPSALRFVVNDLGATHRVCQEELSMVLDELELGRTRVEALTSLGERTQSRAVQDFVAAVCQSETKGTPLVDALSIQAGTLRQRRSVLAEEAAAKAGVRLMFPLMLMVICILLIVFGPLIVNGLGM